MNSLTRKFSYRNLQNKLVLAALTDTMCEKKNTREEHEISRHRSKQRPYLSGGSTDLVPFLNIFRNYFTHDLSYRTGVEIRMNDLAVLLRHLKSSISTMGARGGPGHIFNPKLLGILKIE